MNAQSLLRSGDNKMLGDDPSPEPFMLGARDASECLSTTKRPGMRERFRNLVELRAQAQAHVSLLTPRERQVLELLADGLSSKGIAHVLGLSERTVEIHRGNMYKHLGVRSLAHAVRIWVYTQLPLGSV